MRITNGNTRYTNDLSVLRDAEIIDQNLGAGFKSGYSFAVAVDATQTASFTIGAIPQVTSGPAQTGTRKFCMTGRGEIRSDRFPGDLGINITNDGDCSPANYNTNL